MQRTIDGMRLDLPEDYVLEESKHVLRATGATGIDRRTGGDLVSVRDNVIVHRARAPAGQDLDGIATKRVAELLHALPGLSGLETAELVFADGAIGRLIRFTFPASTQLSLHQSHALRLDEGVLTAVTLTSDAAALTDAVERAQLSLLATIIPGGPP
jgi:hypothetical protein